MGIFKLNGVDYMGGGGGNAKEEIITYAQYLALSEEQRNNGTTYYVYDINGDGEDFQPIIYSTDEREVGVWIDGRPLYEKTFTGQLSGTSLHINIAGLDIDKGWIYDGYYDIGITMLGINEFIGGTSYTRTHINPDSQYLYIDCSNSQANNSTVVVTIRYVKTTDTPGSGTWTPQGIPTQHYSTNEQIVGTWVDGSTLYKKTLIYEKADVSSGSQSINHNISSFNKLINLEAIWAYNNGDCNSGTVVNVGDSNYLMKIWDFGPTDFSVIIGSSAYSIFEYAAFTVYYTKSS